jgi:hypothetical protein
MPSCFFATWIMASSRRRTSSAAWSLTASATLPRALRRNPENRISESTDRVAARAPGAFGHRVRLRNSSASGGKSTASPSHRAQRTRRGTSAMWRPCLKAGALGASVPAQDDRAHARRAREERRLVEPSAVLRATLLTRSKSAEPTRRDARQPHVPLQLANAGRPRAAARHDFAPIAGNSRCSRPSSVWPALSLPTRRTVRPSGNVWCAPIPATSLTDTHSPHCLKWNGTS